MLYTPVLQFPLFNMWIILSLLVIFAADTNAQTTASTTTAATTTTTTAPTASTTTSSAASTSTATTTMATPGIPVTPSCPNPTMTNFLRTVFLSFHNNVRGRIARGQTERNGNFGIAPPASLMYELQYDCNAESYAQSHVRSCDGVLSRPEARPGYIENIHVLKTLATDDAGAAQNAMATWWRELADNGIRTDMLFGPDERYRQSNFITHFTKMAWTNNQRVGCAVQRCKDFYFTSCMYGPGGNNVGERVYNVGAVCAGCPQSCSLLVGLCPY